MHSLLKSLTIFLFLGILAACKPEADNNKTVATDITGADFAQSLSLTDHHGKPTTLQDFKGKAILLFFGYIHCPDVCPTTMLNLKQAMNLLGKRSDEVQVLFVTLDPERDSQEVLAKFVPSFDSRFIGLRGSVAEINATAKVFKIFASKVQSEGGSDYTIDHSAGLYVFDKAGKIRLYVDYAEKPADIARDLLQLL